MSELKPCPFCGGTDIGVSTKFGHAECGQCGATGPWSQHDEAFLAAELRHYWCLRPIEDALRAEVAALKADCRTLETAKADAEALAMSYEGTAERLQAELAKRDEPLTEEQAGDLAQAGDWPITPRGWKIIDAAIRRVRGEG